MSSKKVRENPQIIISMFQKVSLYIIYYQKINTTIFESFVMIIFEKARKSSRIFQNVAELFENISEICGIL